MGLHLSGSTVTQLNNAFARLAGVQAVVSASGALVAGAHNPVDATGGSRTMTLADAASAGLMVAVSKKDSTANTVTVSVAHLRDGGAGTIVLVGQFEALLLTSKADGSWWPVGDHKTKAYFDTNFAGPGTTPWLQMIAQDFGFVFTSLTTVDAATGLPTAAAVRWPDGTTGTFAGTTDGVNGYTGFTVTWAGSSTKTVTVTGITYDSTTGLPLGPTGLAVA